MQLRSCGTDRQGRWFNPLVVQAVWQKGQIVPGDDPSVWRKDVCGAWIRRDSHGDTSSQYGWEVDHVLPVARGGGDELSNLQPLQWNNNRSKGDQLTADYCVMRADS